MFLRIFITASISLALCSNAQAFWNLKNNKRDYIHLVGSSTVSPLMASVSEEFSRNRALNGSPIQTPIVESTGSVVGFELFCSGAGYKYPDFVNASRAISQKERDFCYKNGSRNLMEIKIGYDGIVIAKARGSRSFNLSKEQIFLALADKIYDPETKSLIANPYKKWRQIDSKLPNTDIIFYGPPPSSGTRDVFTDIIMKNTCVKNKEFAALFSNKSELEEQCSKIRNDGFFIASGENDDNIIRSLRNKSNAFGIVGFNFVVVNRGKIKPVKIDGVIPNYKTIASKKYKLSRPLFVYFKQENLELFPELSDFIKEIIHPETIGQKGYLIHSGLVPLNKAELKNLREDILTKLK